MSALNRTLQTKEWISQIVIGLNICPFARESFDQNKICYLESNLESISENFHSLVTKLENKNFDNGFLILENDMSFEAILDLCEDLNEALNDTPIEGKYQLVSFHPDFKFEDTKKTDRVNYVNRSPYPMIHLLNTDVIDKLNLDENHGLEINLRNEKMLKSMSESEFTKYFIKR